MDYLDPKKESQHLIMLYVGYVLIGLAIVMGTFVLVYQAYGFGLSRDGTVIQNGLAFFSSHPNPARIYANGELKPNQTNTRLSLTSGIYFIQLKRDGYRTWQRSINLEGGRVAHYDYPMLFPNTLSPKKLSSYASAPGMSSQTPDRHWLIVQQVGTSASFDVFDLKNPTKAPVIASLPAGLLSPASSSENLQPIEWADDNDHLLLQHNYDGNTEYILLNKDKPAESLNLNKTLSLNSNKLTLRDKKYDQYYSYDQASETVQQVSLKTTTPVAVLTHAIAYQTYGKDTFLYATDVDAPQGKVLIKLQIGDRTTNIRSLSAGSNYLLDIAEYSNKQYVAAGASNENKLYIYKDPIGQANAQKNQALVPAQVLHVTAPNYLKFSSNAQFIMIENGQEFAVYDIENKIGYHYLANGALDAPQVHATWMDGNRLTYVSGGKQIVFDYDYQNRQSLVASDSRYLPAFNPNYEVMFNLVQGTAGGQVDLTQTPLLTPADQ